MMAQRLALAALAVGALLILLLSFLGGAFAAIGFAVLAAAFPFALMILGVARQRLPGEAWGRAVLPIGLALVVVELSRAGMLVLRGRVLDGPWFGGLPLAAAFQIYGIFLLPLAVIALGFALTFRQFGVDERDVERLRELAPKEPV
jgi:hypothetical protein